MSAIRATLLIALSCMALNQPAEAQNRAMGRSYGSQERPGNADRPGISTDGVERRDFDISPTGLTAAFPQVFSCEPISSTFASSERYDGSARRDDRNSGRHGGMDISLDEGTPVLAMASGEVIAKGEGGRLEGFFLWLRHSPGDTGKPYWVFTKYQHLVELPPVNVRDRVEAGQVVALSGSSGTAGGHFASGYPHLHVTNLYASQGYYGLKGEYQSNVFGKDTVNDDTLILFLPGIFPTQVRDLPDKTVPIAVVGDDGAIFPAGSKVVWPVRCKKK